ncbi:MAG: RNA polymerase sigma factor [Anaerolineae bacterium]|nr:RNA polymerase sigma factor [Anaerolineae bacterium]MDW8300316.1 RNA polymerase sigma factor [Anaerolineae bacterium]
MTQSARDPNEEARFLDLIARCRQGDQAAYEALYNAVASDIYRLAYSLLLHRQDSEDVVQEVMVYVFRSLHHFNPERGSFRTWLYTITVSRCRNARRRKWLPTVALSALLGMKNEPRAPESQSPEVATAWRNACESLERALSKLSPRLREAIALRYGQGLTYREMAEVLDCPQKTAESRVRLAHEALRNVLNEIELGLLEEFSGT